MMTSLRSKLAALKDSQLTCGDVAGGDRTGMSGVRRELSEITIFI
jgi:hypothetical protein